MAESELTIWYNISDKENWLTCDVGKLRHNTVSPPFLSRFVSGVRGGGEGRGPLPLFQDFAEGN